MRHRVATIGSLTRDIFIRPRRQEQCTIHGEEHIAFCVGDKIRITEKHETFGGGGGNVAVGLKRFGIDDVAVIGSIGEDENGEKIIHHLHNEGVNTKYVQRKGEMQSGFSVILSEKSGRRVVFYHSGANAALQHLETALLPHFSVLCIGHIANASDEIFRGVARHLHSHPNIFISWNPGRDVLEKGIAHFSDFLSRVDLLLLNKEEAQLFTRKNRYEEIFSALYGNGMQKNTIITDSTNGAYGCDGKQLFFCPIFAEKQQRKDTLGAGDSFLSGAVGGILTGKKLPDAMKYGTINAAFVVSHFGAQHGLQTETELQKYMSDISVEELPFSLF